MAVLRKGFKLKGSKGVYRILNVLGKGGFGVTYLALFTDPVTQKEKRVAIKEFFPVEKCRRKKDGTITPKAISDRTFQILKDKFYQEGIRLLREFPFRSDEERVESDIVQVLDIFSANGTAYLCMNYIDGNNLKEVVQAVGTPGLTEEFTLKIAMKIAKALSKVHQRGLIHRDIKPSNIMITNGDDIVLIDFGSAREFSSSGSHTVFYTEGFTPIEQYSGRGSIQSDVYSLGASMFFCLTGQKPLSATLSENSTQTILEDLNKVNPALSEETKNIIVKSMHYNEGGRHPNMTALKTELESALGKVDNSSYTDTDATDFGLNKPDTKPKANILRLIARGIVISVVLLAGLIIYNSLTNNKRINSKIKFIEIRGGELNGETIPAFNLQESEVTNEAFCEFLNARRKKISFDFIDKEWIDLFKSKIYFENNSYYIKKGYNNYPVNYVTYEAAFAFANYYDFRLPTLKEWEFAAQWNNKITIDKKQLLYIGWFKENSSENIHPVKTRKNDDQALFDLLGNVSEWVISKDTNGSIPYITGGNYQKSVYDLNESNYKEQVEIGSKSSTVGFRCVKKY